MSETNFDLHEHLKQEHKISPFQTYLKEIVYGGIDGIITTFAVVAGFAGAQHNSTLESYPVLIVLLFGLANLFADGASMALSSFLSSRSEKDVYKAEQKKELHEIKNNAKMEKQETIEILQQKGFTKDQAEKLTAIYATNEKYWLSFMMNYELELPDPTGENSVMTSLATFLSFITFGAVPLLPYILFRDASSTFLYSIIAALAALIVLGLLRWKVTIESALRSILEIVFVGSIAACIAYLVGTFFKI
jgi:VIT1/CCC1 family predicted Fe2+/Mn2+ transporter